MNFRNPKLGIRNLEFRISFSTPTSNAINFSVVVNGLIN